MTRKRATANVSLLLSIILSVIAVALPAQATWHHIMTEDFERPPNQWPWATAGHSWGISPGDNRWGIQATYYHVGFGVQSAWCYMDPGNEHDPEFDPYPSNFYTYMYWGPFDLSQAEAALAAFHIFNRTYSGDSLYWAGSESAGGQGLLWSGSHSGTLSGFEERIMDFANLRNAQGDSVSLLGERYVYIYFLFRSNGDANVDMGGFVDDLVIAWDDGLVDLAVVRLTFLKPDSSVYAYVPVYGDTVIAELRWATYGRGLLPPFHLVGTFDEATELDTLIDWAEGEEVYLSYYPAKVMSSGDHGYSFLFDPTDEVEETYEDNNQLDSTFHVDEPNLPPEFTWVRPGLVADTTDESYLLQWAVDDAEDNALLYLYFDTDTFDFNGYIIPGGAGISEDDGPDTLRWNVAAFPNGEVLWPYARVDDPVNSVQLYARAPVVVQHGSETLPRKDPAGLTFSLSQNFPNPFNEATIIRFSIAEAGPVTLRVCDLLGHEKCVLLNERLSPGTYSATLNTAGWPSGLYLGTLTSSQGNLTRKMVLLK